MQKLKKGDTVEVIAGKDITQRGEVVEMIKKESRVVVSGVNIMKKHQKARQAGRQQVQAQILEFNAPIHISNVMVVCPKCDKATRVGIRVRQDGTRTRFCKKCNAEID